MEEIKNKEQIQLKNRKLPKKPEYIQSEVNFLIYPFATLDRKSKEDPVYKSTIKQNDKEIEIEWRVVSSKEYGIPGPSALETDLVIQKLIEDKRRILGCVPKYIQTSLYEIEKLKGRNAGVRPDEIEHDLKSLVTASIESKRAFYEKGKKKWGDMVFHKYDTVAMVGESTPDVVKKDSFNTKDPAEHVYVVLSDIYRDNLEVYYTKRLNYTYMMDLLTSFDKRLYQLLSIAFITRMDNGYVKYNYKELCMRLPITPQKYISLAKQQLNSHLDTLIEREYIKKYEWEEKTEWAIVIYPGPIAQEEMKDSKNGLQVPTKKLQLKEPKFQLTGHEEYVLNCACEKSGRKDDFFQNTVKKYVGILGSNGVERIMGRVRESSPDKFSNYLLKSLANEVESTK